MKPNNQPPRKSRLFVVLVVANVLLLTASRAAAQQPLFDTPMRERIYAMVDSSQKILERRDLETAGRLYQNAVELTQSQKDYLAAAALQNLPGDLLERSGRYQRALQQYEFGLGSLQTREAGQLGAPVDEIISQLQGMEKTYRGGSGARAANPMAAAALVESRLERHQEPPV